MQTCIQDISESIRLRRISPVELTKQCLDRIEKLNPVLNAFITVTAESALAEAKAAEQEISEGKWRGPLHGIPVGLKDLIDTAGVLTTAASALYKDRIPSADADVVSRLKQAGAVLLGKQNMHEFAYGGSSMISHFGEVRNAWNPAHIAGGSSGGSATALVAGMCFASTGTDTAGSVREPAAQCGIVGLKATYGRVSTHGVIPLSSSLDHVGPLTLCVWDAAAVLQVIAIPNAQDEAGVTHSLPNYVAELDWNIPSLRIGIPRKFFYEDIDPDVARAVEEAISVLKRLGGAVRDFDLDVPTDRTLQSAESYAIHTDNISRHPKLYQPETLRRILNGAGISADDLLRSRRQLDEARASIRSVFKEVDVLVTPATPIPAPAIEDLKRDPDLLRPKELILLRNTRPFNVWGLPAISVPCGFTATGLPIGLQIVGPHWEESRVLRVAHAYEKATEWHNRTPGLAMSSI